MRRARLSGQRTRFRQHIVRVPRPQAGLSQPPRLGFLECVRGSCKGGGVVLHRDEWRDVLGLREFEVALLIAEGASNKPGRSAVRATRGNGQGPRPQHLPQSGRKQSIRFDQVRRIAKCCHT